jgi:CubicO group peptidase (beta-lactamase class C family)
MSLTAGAKLGPYETVSPLGAGGMGKVYRARRRHMLNLQLAQEPHAIVKFMARCLARARPGRSGTTARATHIVGALVRAVVKRPLAQYLSEKIWSKLGIETDATWWLESQNGMGVGGSASTRPYVTTDDSASSS